MLFNSYPFLLLFLPATLLGYVIIGRTLGRGAVFGWLVLASLFFYGWWNWFNLALLLTSLVFNYAAGTWLGKLSENVEGGRSPHEKSAPGRRGHMAKVVLGFALAFNIGFLAYFKYADFFISNVNALFGAHWRLLQVVLPLGISFYTFQKIAYLVDSYQGLTRGYGFRDFCLFVSFFPQLIAGPITHHGEIMPQFRKQDTKSTHWEDWSVGLTLFVFGLSKKVLLADRLATIATPVFRGAKFDYQYGMGEAWLGVLAYTLQLYFDFSGYSDMAIGLARLFGIRLPMNFNSPYKAANIADFWRRWHITLSRFLRDYIYIPLGGNRRGLSRKYVNLLITMLIGGFWHGAGWTFIIWGALHGTYLLIYHAWKDRISPGSPIPHATAGGGNRFWPGILARAFTFLLVVIAWVFFRADNWQAAGTMLASMFGAHGFTSDLAHLHQSNAWVWVIPALLGVWFCPNSHDVLARFNPALDFPEPRGGEPRPPRFGFSWRPAVIWSLVVATLAIASVLGFSRASEFIYWQF